MKPLDLLANKLTGDDDEGEWEEVGKKDKEKKESYQDSQKKTKDLYNSYLENLKQYHKCRSFFYLLL